MKGYFWAGLPLDQVVNSNYESPTDYQRQQNELCDTS